MTDDTRPTHTKFRSVSQEKTLSNDAKANAKKDDKSEAADAAKKASRSDDTVV